MTNIRTVLALALLYCYATIGHSQTFNKRYGVDDLSSRHSCRSSTYANGYIYSHIGQYDGLDTWVYKLDLEGNVIETYSYADTTGRLYNQWANSIHPFHDDKLIFSSIYQRNSDDVVFGRLTAIDLEGNLIWQKTYGDSVHTHTIYQVVPTTDGGLITNGTAVLSEDYPVFYVLKTDAEGNEQWHKYLGDEPLFRNGIWVTESHYSNGYAVSGFEDITSYDPAGLVYILNHEGDVIDSRKYENWSNYDSQGVESIQSCSNGGYVFTTEFNTSFTWPPDHPSKPQLVRIDDNLDVLWTCDLLSSWQGNRVQVVIETSGGGFVTVGSTHIRYPQETTAKYEGYISKVSETGELLWQRFYHHAEFGDNGLYDIDELPNGGFLCSGETSLIGPFGDSLSAQSAWLLAIDEMGCLVPGCDTLGVGITEFNPVQFSIYPNPADQFINVAFSKHDILQDVILGLYDMQGKLLKSVAITHPQATYMLDSAHLPNGTYLLKVENGYNTLATQKVIVRH